MCERNVREMRPEMRLARALKLVVDRVVTPIEGMHRIISSKWFRALDPIARPVQIIHDTVAAVVYGSIRAGAAAVGWGIDATEPSAATTDPIQAWVNGLWGDGFGQDQQALEVTMAVRDEMGEAVTPSEAAASVSHVRPHLVFLVHGLFETERRWMGTETRPGLARVLRERSEVTPVLIRYNTGLAVEHNGLDLANLVQDIVDEWPLPVKSVSLVGHSMGGLVVSSACAAAATSDRTWVDSLTDLVTIGTPHGGAPLEMLVAALFWGLNVAETTRPIASFLDRRSQGIKDLGARSAPSAELDRLAGVRHHLVGGVVTTNPSHPLGILVGDLVVPATSSASTPIEPINTLILGGVHHFQLLDEPAVTDHIARWLKPTHPAELARATRMPSGI